MSTAQNETNGSPVHQDIETRIRDFGSFAITAFRNFTVLIILVGGLWSFTKVVQSTIHLPFLLRWTLILCLCLNTIAKNAWLFRIIAMTYVKDQERSQNPNSGKRTTNLENWTLANFCVLVGMSSMGFVAWYWIEVIALTARTFFYWTCTIGGLFSSFWFLKRTIRFYQKMKGVQNEEEACGILIGVIVVRLFYKLEGLLAEDVIEQFLDAGRLVFDLCMSPLIVVGFRIGRGPLFGKSVVQITRWIA